MWKLFFYRISFILVISLHVLCQRPGIGQLWRPSAVLQFWHHVFWPKKNINTFTQIIANCAHMGTNRYPCCMLLCIIMYSVYWPTYALHKINLFFYYLHLLANILRYTCVVHICKYMNKVHVNDDGDLSGSFLSFLKDKEISLNRS